jgi:hypothetical protein
VPFLRVIRDKRGYETTYLMHWYREGSRQRSRILYVFRTPGGVRVGREALEPEILKQIEREYPEIDFDWPVVVENQQVVDVNPEPRRPRKRRRDEDGGEPAPAPPAEKPVRADPVQPAAQPSRPPVPSAIAGATPDEQIAFLAVWYPLIRERIHQRPTEPARDETLLALCERLNTTSWTDADQITSGLQQAAEALERLSVVFAKRRRRSRRPRKPGAPDAADPGSPEADPPTSDS